MARTTPHIITRAVPARIWRPGGCSPVLGWIAPRHKYSSSSLSAFAPDPLRILFCGSDEFSCVSLQALHREALRDCGLVGSIDVLVRPAKPAGRGMRKLRHSQSFHGAQGPVKTLADQLSLLVHERDTFTGWTMPDFINLIVAVSFGLFVPIRILRSAKYRGLNLHASLLPDLRGPAPIQHSIIAGRSHTGVTLQTLDEQSFDKGLILDQTPRPGIPITDTADTAALTSTLATHAADMLVRALRSGLHLPPLRAVPCPDSTLSLVHATKLTKADRRVDLSDPCLTAVDVLRRARALGPLWIEIASPAATANPVRLILDGIAEAECPQSDDCQPRLIACHPPSTRGGASRLARAYVCTGSRGHVIFALLAGGFISVGKVTVPGQQACTAAKALAPYLVLDEVRSRRAPLVNVSD